MKTNQMIIWALAVMMQMSALETQAQTKVEEWGRFEKVMKGPSHGNPFQDVTLEADFWQEDVRDTIHVNGFYDGDGKYVVRFMPQRRGVWHYRTSSNVPALNQKRGKLQCVPTSKNHGMVKVSGVHHFAYADGVRYYPVGTTAYAWAFMADDIRRKTLQSLRIARFNKIRMCAMPKYYDLCEEEPTLFPFVQLPKSLTDESLPIAARRFDLSRFNPAFFRDLENCIDSLHALGVEADLILFHPYDKGHWGFDSMPMEVNKAYVRYICARLSSFCNVWWSLSNEYDYVKAKTMDDWNALIKEVNQHDPYHHLCSIHGSTATYFPYWQDGITHTSIQDEGPVMEAGRASILYNIYQKPVVLDEVCYEGNLERRWGRLSGEEMLYRMWQGLVNGVYVTHGDCYKYHENTDTIAWAKGGYWRGESWKRISFMRNILEALPGPLQMADVSRDDQTSTAGEGYYLVYFGKRMQDEWLFNLPAKNANYQKLRPGKRFNVEIIDTWNMTITQCPQVFEMGKANDYRLYDKDYKKIRLPLRPYLLLRITEENKK